MSGQKHLLLEVPDYDHTGGGGKAPRTYLQLGAYPTDGTPASRGDDLLDRIGLTEGVTHYFKDDFRHRNGQQHPETKYWRDDGHEVIESDPVTLTKELRTRGGWRLHTDGNYVSTTRGDRVDVIGGNYKMVILGRMNAPGEWAESYYESSGGHNRDATNTPGEMIMVAWNPATQTWRTVEEVIKGDTVSNFQGIVREFYECDLMLSFTGSASEGAPIPASTGDGAHTHTDFTQAWIHGPPPRLQQNPNVHETVRALSITERTKVETVGGTGVTTDTGKIVHPIADRTITSTAQYRRKSTSTAATTIDETLSVEGGVTITSKVGEGPPPGSAPGTPPVAPVPTFRETLLAGVILSTSTYREKTVAGAGDVTRKINVHGRIFELGIETTFDQVLAEFGRHEFATSITLCKVVGSITGSLAVTIGMTNALNQGVSEFQQPDTPKPWEKALYERAICLVWRQYIAARADQSLLRFATFGLLTKT